MRRISLFITLILGSALSLSVSAQTVLRFSNWLPPTHLVTTEIIQPWARSVEKETEGRVKVQIVPALGKPDAHLDLVSKGVADVAISLASYTPDRFVLLHAMTLPLFCDDPAASSVAFWRIYQKDLAKFGEFDSVKLLMLSTHGPAHLHTAKKRVQSLDDARGLKIRVPGGVAMKGAEALGVSPVFAPATQSYEMLSNGVVDGVFFDNDSVIGFKLEKILKQALVVPGGLYCAAFFAVMNEEKYNKLSDEDRAAVDRVSGEAFTALAGRAWEKGERKATAALRAGGYEFVEAPPQVLQQITERLKPIAREWIDKVKSMGVDGDAVLADFRTGIEKVQAEEANR